MQKILITGATGNVGKAILRHINHDKATVFEATSSDTAVILANQRYFNFEDSSSYATALSGIKTLFLLRPPALATISIFSRVIDEAKKQKVESIVFLSVQGVEKSKKIPHHQIEKLIKLSGIDYLFIRPSYFMQNLTTTFRDEIVNHHQIYLPVGHSPFNWIDVNDIGLIVAELLTRGEPFNGAMYTLTAEKNITFKEACQLLSQALGHPVVLKSPNPVSYFFTKKRQGHDTMWIKVMILLHFFPRFAKAPSIFPDAPQLLGHAPKTLERFIIENRTIWQANKG